MHAARIGLLVALGFAAVVGCGSEVVPSPALQATQSAEASLVILPLPGTTSSPAGEYGWEGGPDGHRWGMHRVVGRGNAVREATAVQFQVGRSCLTASPELQLPVRVAGFDGVSVEPYEPPIPFGASSEGQITRAYALAVEDRTLCVYLTWNPATTEDELDAAVRILDTLRAQPIGKDRIRIVFTLEEGWDTG